MGKEERLNINVKLEVIRLANEDVIATSTVKLTYTGYCYIFEDGNSNNVFESNDFFTSFYHDNPSVVHDPYSNFVHINDFNDSVKTIDFNKAYALYLGDDGKYYFKECEGRGHSHTPPGSV